MKSKPITLLVFALLIIGLVFISVSSLAEAAYTAGDKLYFIRKQLIWSAFGIITYYIGVKINLNLIKKYSHLFLYLTIGLLLLVLLPQFSTVTLGAKRWLDLGIFSIQPSEIFKISAIIFFSSLFSRPDNVTIQKLIIFLTIPLVLILLEPNMSTAVLISAIVITIYYLAGGEIVPLFGLCAVGLLAGSLLIFMSPYRKARLNPESYHSNQMIIALSSGHLIGKGFANSDQKYRYLPKISTDSILAVIGEETGFIGISGLITLYLVLILKIIKIGQQSAIQFNRLLAISIGCWIAYQSLINISAVVSLIPLTGVPLPLISYGGSSLLTLLFALGIAENINQQSIKLVYSNKHEDHKVNHHHRHPSHSSH